jgi:hypothetical protein
MRIAKETSFQHYVVLLFSTSSEKDRCIMVQIFDSCKEPVAVRGLSLTGREKLLLGGFIAVCSSTVVAMHLCSARKGR